MAARTYTTQELCKLLNLDGAGLNKLVTDARDNGRVVKPMGKRGEDTIWDEESVNFLRFELTGETKLPENFLEFFKRKQESLASEEAAKHEAIRQDYTKRRLNLAELAAEEWVNGFKKSGNIPFSELCARVTHALDELRNGDGGSERKLTPHKKEELAQIVLDILGEKPGAFLTAFDIFKSAPPHVAVGELQRHWDRVRLHLLSQNKIEMNEAERNQKGYRLAEGA